MKPAEAIYNEVIPRGLIVFPDTKAAIIEAMRAYAEQAIDRCAEKAENHLFGNKHIGNSVKRVKSELK